MSDPGKKPFYASKTLWVNLLAGIFAFGQTQGWMSVDVSAQAQVVVLGVVNMVLRIITKDSVALS